MMKGRVILMACLVHMFFLKNNAQTPGKHFIANGENHLLFLRCEGNLLAWGANLYGQGGTNISGQTANANPTYVHGVANNGFLNEVLDIVAGSNHSLALLCSGKLVAWGNNAKGQLGDNTNIGKPYPVEVKGLPDGAKIIAMAAGAEHSMVLLSDGSVYTWGSNDSGQLGDGTVSGSNVPVKVKGVGGSGFLNDIVSIEAGISSSFAITKSGNVVAWGKNNKAQLGIAGSAPFMASPAMTLDSAGVNALTDVVQVAAGNEFTLFLLKNKRVLGCGDKSNGQLADGAVSATVNLPLMVKGVPEARSISAGWDWAVAVKADSTAVAWGNNSKGQLGAMVFSPVSTVVPVRNETGTANLKGIAQVSCGKSAKHGVSSFYVYTGNKGLILSSGNNTFGELAVTNSAMVNSFETTKTAYPLLTTNSIGGNNFNISKSSACTNEDIVFTSVLNTPGYTYTWSFGSGAVPASHSGYAPPPVKYNTAGTKQVTLVIRAGNCSACSDTIRKAVTINGGIADFTISSLTGCVGQGLNFYALNTDTVITRFNWDFGPGANPATSTDPYPKNIVYPTMGPRQVTLTINNAACGNVAPVTHVITINPSPLAAFTIPAMVCEGTNVPLTNSSTSGANVQYQWNFGAGANPAASGEQNPTGLVYVGAGSKKIILKVTNQFGCTAEAQNTITVEARPKANFMSNTPICSGQEAAFTYTGTSATTYQWDFGTGSNPTVTTIKDPAGIVYSSAGIKTITLIAAISGSSCKDTLTKSILINQSPEPKISSNAPKCSGQAVNFSNTGSHGNNWQYAWNFGSDATPTAATAENPAAINFSKGGTKKITLTMTDGTCTKTDTVSINIMESPKVNFVSNAPVCSGLPVTFSFTGTNAANYNWDFGTGANPANSNLQSPSGVVYTSAGIKTIKLIAGNTNNSCKDSLVRTITINASPEAEIVPPSPTCAGTLIDFVNQGSHGSNWQYNWSFGSDATPVVSTNENPTAVSFATGGTKLVTLTITDGICTKTDTQTVVIKESPKANFSSTAPVCSGSAIDFSYTGTGAGTYNWSFGAGANIASSASATPSGIIYVMAGIKNVKLIVYAANSNCKDSITKAITIFESPVAKISSNAPKCSGEPLNFTNSGSHGSNWMYSWNFGTDGNPSVSTAENPVAVVFSSGGTKNVTLTITDGICTRSDTQTVVILQSPKADFSTTAPVCSGMPVDFLNTGTTSGVNFAWSFGTAATPATSVVQNPTGVVFSTAGTHVVFLKVNSISNHCKDSSTQVITIYQSPKVSFQSTAPRCPGTPVNFTNTGSTGGSWSYNWSFGTNAAPSGSGAEHPSGIIYSQGGAKKVSLTVTNGLCTKTDTMSILIYPRPVADAGMDTTICAGASVQIGSSPVPNYVYQWFPSSTLSNGAIANPVASPAATTTHYMVSVVNTTTGCNNKDSILVSMLPPVVANAGEDVEICLRDSAQIGYAVVPGQVYSWTPASGLSSATLSNPLSSPATTTTYTLSVSAHGCPPIKDEVKVVVNPLPLVEAGPADTATTLGAPLQLVATGAIQYTWSPAAGLSNSGIFNPLANPAQTTVYVVKGVDVFGCSNSDTITVRVIAPDLWAPTAFTPDGNGYNDVFYIRGHGVKNFEFRIFNEWGEEVFFTTDMNEGWDGKKMLSGEALPQGAYIYNVRGVLSNGVQLNKKDMVSLIR